MSAAPYRPQTYRPEIDGLRAIAVLAVLLNHLNHQWLPGGYLGVDLFFVISGCVVTGSLLRHSHSSWRQFLLGFYARRFRRLLPALLVCVLLSSIAGSLVIAPEAIERLGSLRTGLASLIGASNLYQLRQSTDYFGASAELNLFTHTWSLGVEEQYYLVYPLLVGLCGLVRGAPGQVRRRLRLALALLIPASLLLQWHLWSTDQSAAAFFLTPARFWQLGLGALCWLLPARWLDASGHRLAQAATLLAFLLLLGCFTLPLSWQQPATLAAGVLSTLLLLGLASPSPLRQGLCHPALVGLGLRSYSLYLWHWPVLVLARWTVGITPATLAPLLLLIGVFSEASYRWIEQPLRQRAWASSQLGTILRGGLVVGLAGGAMVLLEGAFGRSLFLGSKRPPEAPWFEQVGVAGSSIRGDRCNAIPTDGPELSAAMASRCRSSGPGPGGPIALLGDSHALHLLPLLEQLHQRFGSPVLHLSRSACAIPAPGPSVQAGCQPFSAAAVDEAVAFTASQPGAPAGIVLVSNYLMGHFRPGGDLHRQFRTPQGAVQANTALNLAAYGQALGSLASRLAAQGGAVVVVAPPPEQRSRFGHPQLCRSEWFRPSPPPQCQRSSTSRAALEADRAPILAELRRQAAAHPNLLIFDPFPLLCPAGDGCSTHQGDQGLFRDKDHISKAAAMQLLPSLEQIIQQLPSKV